MGVSLLLYACRSVVTWYAIFSTKRECLSLVPKECLSLVPKECLSLVPKESV